MARSVFEDTFPLFFRVLLYKLAKWRRNKLSLKYNNRKNCSVSSSSVDDSEVGLLAQDKTSEQQR